MKRTPMLSLLALTTTCASVASGQSPVTLTLDEAVSLALQRNPAIESAALAEARANEELHAARTRRLPTFNVETQASRLLRSVDLMFPAGAFGSFPSTGPVPSVDTTVTTPAQLTMVVNASAAQAITGLIPAGLAIRQRENGVAQARQEARATHLATVRQVRRAYYAILEATSALEATTLNGRLLSELGRVVSNRVSQQTALKADSLDVEARLAEHELTRLSARHAVASAKEQLNQLLGRPIETDFEVEPMWEAVDTSGGAGVPPQSDARPDVEQARLRTVQAELAVRIGRADMLPELNVVVQSITPMNITGAPRNITTAGVQLKWEPFDWGRKARAVAARRLDARRAMQAQQDVEAAAQIDVNRARRAIEQARLRLQSASGAQALARERARVRATQYQLQAVLLTDALQAQATLAESTHAYQRAVLSLLVAHADLDHALGKDITR